MKTAFVRRATISIALAAAALGLMANPASADPPILDTDGVLINGAQVDFGDNPHWFGSPQTPGHVTWTDSGSGITARLTGRVFFDSGKSGCGRVRMTMYNKSGAVIGVDAGGNRGSTYSGRACRAGSGGLVSKYVDLPLTDPAAFKVVITTQTAPAQTSTTYQSLQSVTRYFGLD
jgi:hypothetical protein